MVLSGIIVMNKQIDNKWRSNDESSVCYWNLCTKYSGSN